MNRRRSKRSAPTSPPPTASTSSLWKKLVVALGVLAVGIVAGIYWQATVAPRVRGTRQMAQRALEVRDWPLALQVAEELLRDAPQSAELRLIAGEAAGGLGNYSQALEHYAAVSDRAPLAPMARWAAAEIQYELGNWRESLELLESALKLDGNLLRAHDRKAQILTTLGRRWESLPSLLRLIQSDDVTVDHLLKIGNLAKEITAQSEIERLKKLHPDDRALDLPLAIHLREQGQFADSQRLLQALIEQHPDLLEARVHLGWTLLKISPEECRSWLDTLPENAWQHPDVWAIEGQLLPAAELRSAIACQLSALAIDAEHLVAHNQLAQLLQREGQAQRAEPFAQRALLIQRLNLALEQIYTSRKHLPPVQEAAELTARLGRPWECVGWCAYALSVDAQLNWPKELIQNIRHQVRPGLPRTLPQFNLATQAEWRSAYPLPVRSKPNLLTKDKTEKPASADTAQSPEAAAQSAQAGIRWTDVAAETGITFQLAQPPRTAGTGRRMYEITGAGTGAIDYDNNGWADLLVVQAGAQPPSLETKSGDSRVDSSDGKIDAHDCLYRSLGRMDEGLPRFVEVSSLARIVESEYGQGPSVGDMDNDGFEDLYVGNFGKNQLWLNMGDGTFISGDHRFSEKLPDQWTVSTAMVDINGDGLTDVYDVNYVSGPDITTRLCPIAGVPRACTPLVFLPAPHVLWLGQADGSLVPFRGPGSELLNGYGLGIAVTRLADNIRPHLFIAIDQQANLLLTLQANGPGQASEQLIDEAVVRGVALDSAGRSQACMGIAAADVTSDGQVDFYVSNFYNESNTLYVQDNGFFQDQSAALGLTGPSLPMLGFGTQAIDAQNDGLMELVVLNGHIDDQTHVNVPFRMRPQVYQRAQSAGRPRSAQSFVDLSKQMSGDPFFNQPRLGRGLTRWDFDADGLEDMVATDLELPLAVLHNRSQAAGRSIAVRLVGTVSQRDAYCTIGTLRAASGWSQTEQLVAGSGYMACNERVLRFAVPLEHKDQQAGGELELSLHLRWPSGIEQQIDQLRPGGQYVIVERAN